MPLNAMRRPRGLLALAGIVAATAAVVYAQAPQIEPSPADQRTVQIVSTLLEHNHLSKPTINDEISKKWCRNYLKSLDPRKYHFTQADIKEFLKFENDLDDTIATGDLSFEKLVFDRFLQRSNERLANALEILDQKPDFTAEEHLSDDPDKLEYPADAAEAKDRLRKYIKFELLQAKLLKRDDAEAKKDLVIRYRDQNRRYNQFDSVEVLELYLTALTTAVDPHSSYMGPRELEDMLNQRLHLTLDGIGASLLSVDGYPVVQEVVPGGAADKDGRLAIEDKIVGVILGDGTRESFVEKKLNDVVRKIRGPRGTKVSIVVIPAETKEEKIYELTRQKIDLADDKAKGQIVEYKVAGSDVPKKFGILNVPSFYGDMAAQNQGDPDAVSVTRDCRKILDDFRAKKVDAVIVDVRMDPGGLLDEAISLSGLFIDKGPVVQVREAHSVRHRDDDEEGTAWDGPMAVIIDHYCASASEIFAGVIKDYGRGLIIGDSSTFGKGSVQSIVPLGDPKNRFEKFPKYGALKLTIQQFYLPNGNSTQVRGVPSDIHIPSFADISDYGEARYDTALKFDKVPPLPHDQYNRVPEDLVAKINELSTGRRQGNPKFKEEEKFLTRAVERKKRHEISLNEEKFRSETRADDEAKDEAPKAKGKGKKGNRRPDTIWESNYYNDEVLAIISDYVTLGQRILVAAPVRAAAVNPEPRPLLP